MKKRPSHILFFAVLLLSGCGGDPFSTVIEADPPEFVKQLAVHCYVNDTDSTIYASLSKTRGLLDIQEELGPIDGGMISLYQDGEKLCDFEGEASGGFNNYVYRGTEVFGMKQGEIELRASAPDFPDLFATQTFPAVVPITDITCLLYTSPSPRDQRGSRMPSSA